MSYYDCNLIRYEDTIRLHFDAKGETAWLTMKNYGFVFGADHKDTVRVVTVGLSLPEGSTTISIGEMLDANAVIALQVGILTKTATLRHCSFPTDALFKVIEEALSALLETPQCQIEYQLENVASTSYKSIRKILATSPYHGTLESNYGFGETHEWTEALLTLGKKEVRPGRKPKEKPKKATSSEPDELPSFAREDFTAYFPNPNFIPDEQRTRKQSTPGLTFRTDTRDITPIPTNIRKPKEWEYQSFFDKIDEGLEKEHQKIHFERLNCYAFRGDKRKPQLMKEGNGFLPGVTRDQDAYKAAGTAIDDSLKPPETSGTAPQSLIREEKQYLNPEYERLIKEHNIMHLGEFISEQNFKGFVSATKSTAIAKCFATFYEKLPYPPVYCYAVRVHGAFHIPSTVPEEEKNPKRYLQNIYEYIEYAEQEVTQPGAIWWDNVFGLRVIRSNNEGQFFTGPVFLRDHLMWEDNNAFSAFFELLSGKSQGDSPRVCGDLPTRALMIDKSYKQRPFPLLEKGLVNRGANRMAQAITFRKPVVRLSQTELTFPGQPVGLQSPARTVQVTNNGDDLLIIESITFQSGVEFQQTNTSAKTVISGAFFTINITYTPLTHGESWDSLRISFKSHRDADLQTATVRLFGSGIEKTG